MQTVEKIIEMTSPKNLIPNKVKLSNESSGNLGKKLIEPRGFNLDINPKRNSFAYNKKNIR